MGTRRVLAFCRRVLARFAHGHGFLFSSAAAYKSLLSAIPLLTLALVVASYVADPQTLRTLVEHRLSGLSPRMAEPIAAAYTSFLEQRKTVGLTSLVVLLAFSSLVFRTLQQAMQALFAAPGAPPPRRPLASVMVSVAYVAMIVTGLLVGARVNTAIDAVSNGVLDPLPGIVSPGPRALVVLDMATTLAVAAVLSSFYRILPGPVIPLRYAIVGGVCVTGIWEGVRRVMVWYFRSVSTVNGVYGSLTSIVVILISLEVGCVVLLLGGQMLAELARAKRTGIPWHRDPYEATDSQPANDESEGT